jgi:excisionase family DNA binding protein
MTEERQPQLPIEPEAFYTLKEVRNYLRISDATARRWVKEGRLRARKIGRDYRVRGEDVLQGAREPFDWSKVKLLTPESRFFELMGIGQDKDGATDVSRNKHKYLAEIYYEKSHPKT